MTRYENVFRGSLCCLCWFSVCACVCVCIRTLYTCDKHPGRLWDAATLGSGAVEHGGLFLGRGTPASSGLTGPWAARAEEAESGAVGQRGRQRGPELCVAVSDAASARGHRTLAPGRVSTFGHARLSDIKFVKKSRAHLVPSLRVRPRCAADWPSPRSRHGPQPIAVCPSRCWRLYFDNVSSMICTHFHTVGLIVLFFNR